MTLRNKIKTQARNNRGKSSKMSFQLNIMPGEFNTDVGEIEIEAVGEEVDKEKRMLWTQVGDLQRNLENIQRELVKSEYDREAEHGSAVHCREQSTFLYNHVLALEQEVKEKTEENESLIQLMSSCR